MMNLSATLCFCLMAITMADALAAPQRVVVSGAGGQTGQYLFRKLLALPEEFQPLGLVRSEESKAALVTSGVASANIAIVDVTDPDAVRAVVGEDVAAFCICTSAKPAPTGEKNPETGGPIFGFPNGTPEVVDWLGQKNQIDACPPGAHVVICSTMGGSNPDHPLNNLGRTINEDGSQSGGNIVKWKRKAEKYLVNNENKKDLIYTIVHPGGLIDDPGGERELVIGVDDDLSYGNTDSQSVPRNDVAQVMLEALRYPKIYGGRSFDLRAKKVEEGTPTTDFETLIDSFLEGKKTDYSLGGTI